MKRNSINDKKGEVEKIQYQTNKKSISNNLALIDKKIQLAQQEKRENQKIKELKVLKKLKYKINAVEEIDGFNYKWHNFKIYFVNILMNTIKSYIDKNKGKLLAHNTNEKIQY